MSRTGFVYHSRYVDHVTGPGHPECPERLEAIVRRLGDSGALGDLQRHEPAPADPEWVGAIHDSGYIRRVEAACASGRPILDEPDTAICADSYAAALLAVGGALDASDRLMEGTWQNAFVACRPPGHHAENRTAMGFCLFNNVAVAAAYLRRRHGVGRVAIVDWDVHHGNGTQHAFEADPSVYYVSLHQWPLYPGTGRAEERGVGEGRGATLNCPMPPGTGDDDYIRVFEETILPELDRFAPEVLLISAGFDAHRADPLSATRVTEDGYRKMTRLLADLAASHTGGRILSLLEGGYDLEALASSVQIHLEGLLEAPAAR